MLVWVAISFSRESFNPGIELGSPTLQADSLPLNHQGSPVKDSGVTQTLLELPQGQRWPTANSNPKLQAEFV